MQLSTGKIYRALTAATQKGYSLFPELKDPGKIEDLKSGEKFELFVKPLLEYTESIKDEPIKALPYSKFKLTDTEGNRSEYEKEYVQYKKRLAAYSFLSVVYKEEESYIAALEDTLWATCDLYTWALPAHLPKGYTEEYNPAQASADNPHDGNIYKPGRELYQIVDLTNAETAFYLSEITYFLEDRLSPLVVRRVRQEVKRRVIDPVAGLYGIIGGEIKPSNWDAVVAGSVGIACIYLVKNEEVLANLLVRLANNIWEYLDAVPADGSTSEGVSYWEYGISFYIAFATLLYQRTNGAIDLLDHQVLKEYAQFPQRCRLSGDLYVNFSDCLPEYKYDLWVWSVLKDRFPEINLPDFKHSKGCGGVNQERWGRVTRNSLLGRLEYCGQEDAEPKSTWLSENKWFVSRSIRGGRIMCLAAKAGNNDEMHNHNDVGSFILHYNGENFLVDLGNPQYTRQYFGETRYQNICASSLGHNVPVIAGQAQISGAKAKSSDENAILSSELDEFSFAFEKAYGNDRLKELKRSLKVLKNGEGKAVLEDRFAFEPDHVGSVTERFVTYIEPVLVKEGTVELKTPKGTLHIIYDAAKLEFCCTNLGKTAKGEERDAYAIDLKMRENTVSGEVTIHFEFI